MPVDYALVRMLAARYYEPEDARRIASAAGIPLELVPFNPRPITHWYNIFREAESRNKVGRITALATKEYPDIGLYVAAQGPEIEEWHEGKLTQITLEKIIGAKSTILPIAYLEAGLLSSRSVGRVKCEDGSLGTGFLTTGNILITNHHVIPTLEVASGGVVEFNYQISVQGVLQEKTLHRLCPDAGFATSEEDDWTAVVVSGNPAQRWGSIEIAPAKPQRLDRVAIIQHPEGGPKAVALTHNVVLWASRTRVQYLTDTLPGSSGSPVFDSDWRLVAMHHSGGWLPEEGSERHWRNEGIHIDVLRRGLVETGLIRGEDVPGERME